MAEAADSVFSHIDLTESFVILFNCRTSVAVVDVNDVIVLNSVDR